MPDITNSPGIHLSAPLAVTLKDLQAGINEEEKSGLVLKGLSISSDLTINVVIVDSGPLPSAPIELRKLSAATASDAQKESDELHRKLRLKGGGVAALGEISIEGKLCFVSAIRQAGMPLPQPAPQPGVITRPGWAFSVNIEGDDLFIRNAKATWFGGPHDSQDSGQTASGIVNTRRRPDFQGCALPMDESKCASTAGSPIPRLRWGTLVEVTSLETGKTVTVPLIDIGPARNTGKAIDLTEPAFEELGISPGRGVTSVDIRIRNLPSRLHPASSFAFAEGASIRKEVDPETNEKILPIPAGGGAAALAALIDSLKLPNFSSREILETMERSRGGIKNQVPPPSLFPNIIPTLCILQQLRIRLGVPLHPTSTYRSPQYNKAVDGAVRSQHLAFRAIDVQSNQATPAQIYSELRKMRGTRIPIPIPFAAHQIDPAGVPFILPALDIKAASSGAEFIFHGGLGEYPTFVHVDCRGEDANWG